MIRILWSGWGDRSCGDRSSRGVETTWKKDLAMKLRWIDSKGVNNHPEAALASLAKLEAVQTTWVLPVHGAPWRGDAE